MPFCTRCGISIEGRFCPACGYDNQPQEKAQSIEETVNQLYSLRAGISLISNEINKIDKKDADGRKYISDQEALINTMQGEAAKKNLDAYEKKQFIAKHRNDVGEDKLNELTRKRALKEEEFLSKQKKAKKTAVAARPFAGLFTALGWIFLVLGIVAMVIIVGALFGGELKHVIKSREQQLLYGGIFIGSTIFIILGIIFKVAANGLKKKTIVESESAVVTMLTKEISKQKQLNATFEQYKRVIPILEKRSEELRGLIEMNNSSLVSYRTELKDEIKYYKLCTSEAYKGLVDKYSPLLDVRDWQNLDLVIYYLETRRAISIREALQLTDRQHQTEAIINTFKAATEQIKDTIAYHSQKIQSAVYETASVISSQLEDASGKLNAISVGQDITNSYLRNLSSEAAVSNALRTQANKTSHQMMEDIKQIRTYADNDAIRARNS